MLSICGTSSFDVVNVANCIRKSESFLYIIEKVQACTVIWNNMRVTLHKKKKKTCLTVKM